MRKIYASVALATSLAAPTTTIAQVPSAVCVQCAVSPADCTAIVRQAIAAIKASIIFRDGRITNAVNVNASIGAILAEVVKLYEFSQLQTGDLQVLGLDYLGSVIAEVLGDRDGNAAGSGYVASGDARGNLPDFTGEILDEITAATEGPARERPARRLDGQARTASGVNVTPGSKAKLLANCTDRELGNGVNNGQLADVVSGSSN